MKVILLQDVARIGKRHSTVEVPDGYALNQLIPKKMAVPATPENSKKVQKLNADKAAQQSADETAFTAAATALQGVTLTIAADMNEKNHLFKAISVDDVVQAAGAQGVVVPAAAVRFETPIKEGGEHTVQLVHGTKIVPITVSIIKK